MLIAGSWITITPGTVRWITPCQISKPASVTTNDGTPTSATIDPWKAPISAAARIARKTQRYQGRCGAVRQLRLGDDDAGDAADEGDGEVDLADQEHEDDAVGEQARARHLRDDVREVRRREEVLRGLAEDEDDERERDDDRPAAEVRRSGCSLERRCRQRLVLSGLDLTAGSAAVVMPAAPCGPGIPETFVGLPAVIACTTSSCDVFARSKTPALRPRRSTVIRGRGLEDVVEVVRDQDDAEALLGEAVDEREHLLGLRDAERRRRLVEDDEP